MRHKNPTEQAQKQARKEERRFLRSLKLRDLRKQNRALEAQYQAMLSNPAVAQIVDNWEMEMGEDSTPRHEVRESKRTKFHSKHRMSREHQILNKIAEQNDRTKIADHINRMNQQVSPIERDRALCDRFLSRKKYAHKKLENVMAGFIHNWN